MRHQMRTSYFLCQAQIITRDRVCPALTSVQNTGTDLLLLVCFTRRIDHDLPVDHVDPNLPLWDVVQDLRNTDPTQESCPRSCRLYCSHRQEELLLLLLGCLRFTKFCWVGKHVHIIMKPTNSPTPGQPHPRLLIG